MNDQSVNRDIFVVLEMLDKLNKCFYEQIELMFEAKVNSLELLGIMGRWVAGGDGVKEWVNRACEERGIDAGFKVVND